MLVAIEIYLAIGAMYTAHTIENTVSELNKDDEFGLNTENRAVLTMIFIVCIVTYPLDVIDHIRRKFSN